MSFLGTFVCFFVCFYVLELKRIRWLQTIKWRSLRADSRDQRFSTSVSSLRERMRPARAERSSRGLAPSQIHGKPFPDSPRRNARLAALVMRSCPQTTDKDNSSTFRCAYTLQTGFINDEYSVLFSLLLSYILLNRNPMGRTGIAGRGLFGRWGPNHAVHVVVTRWAMLNLCRSAPTFSAYFA